MKRNVTQSTVQFVDLCADGPIHPITRSYLLQANAENMDVTGKAGATLYAAASDPTAPMSAWMKGSIPNYRAESQYILSGIFGNYEKELENKNTMSVVGGKVPARQVAYTIIDDAYKDTTSPDCTGSVDASGVHGVGKGTPPCTAMLKFNKPTGKCFDFMKVFYRQRVCASMVHCCRMFMYGHISFLFQKISSHFSLSLGLGSMSISEHMLIFGRSATKRGELSCARSELQFLVVACWCILDANVNVAVNS